MKKQITRDQDYFGCIPSLFILFVLLLVFSFAKSQPVCEPVNVSPDSLIKWHQQRILFWMKSKGQVHREVNEEAALEWGAGKKGLLYTGIQSFYTIGGRPEMYCPHDTTVIIICTRCLRVPEIYWEKISVKPIYLDEWCTNCSAYEDSIAMNKARKMKIKVKGRQKL